MNEPTIGPKSVDTGERMATIAKASVDAMKHKAQGEHETEKGARYSVPLSEAESIIEDSPKAPKEGARQMLKQYGAPNEATPTKCSVIARDLLEADPRHPGRAHSQLPGPAQRLPDAVDRLSRADREVR